jgi:hypothetical protein
MTDCDVYGLYICIFNVCCNVPFFQVALDKSTVVLLMGVCFVATLIYTCTVNASNCNAVTKTK